MSEWISVKDGMPPLSENSRTRSVDVLAVDDCGRRFVGSAYTLKRGSRPAITVWEDYHGREMDVTHWTQIPKVPR